MKTLFTVLLIGTLYSQFCFGEDKSPLPLALEQVVTKTWAKGCGFYRVAAFNSEIDPCLLLESVQLCEPAHLVHSKKLCSVRINGNEREFKKDAESVFIEKLRWQDSASPEFDLDLFGHTHVRAKCMINGFESGNPASVCSSTESEPDVRVPSEKHQ